MNNNINEIYSDGIGKIHFFGGMLRLDLFSFQPVQSADEKEEHNPEPEITTRIVMSPNAFLASYQSFVNMIQKLTDAGILAKGSEDTASNEKTDKENNSSNN